MSDEDVMAALSGCWRVSYPSLLDRLRGLGVEPSGMVPALERLERFGLIRQLDRQGRRWSPFGDARGPLFIEVRAPFS